MAVSGQRRLISAQPHRAAQIAAFFALLDAFFAHPFRDDANDRLVCRAKFGGGGVGDARKVPRGFHTGHLHPEANAEIGHLPFTGEADAGNLAFRPAFAKGAGDEDGVQRLQSGGDITVFRLKQFRVDPLDVDLHTVGNATMDERFVQRLIGILQADIFADDANVDLAFRIGQPVHDVVPTAEIRVWPRLNPERAQHF